MWRSSKGAGSNTMSGICGEIRHPSGVHVKGSPIAGDRIPGYHLVPRWGRERRRAPHQGCETLAGGGTTGMQIHRFHAPR